MSRRLQRLALIALAALAAALLFLAFRDAGSQTTAGPGDGAATVGTPVAGGSATGEGDGDGDGDGDAAPRTAAAPREESDPSPLEAARTVLGSDAPVTLSVLGDSTSNTRQEWVHLWAATLAEDRPVTISHWDEGTEAGFLAPNVLSAAGAASPLTIWSGSQGGASAAYPTDRLGTIVPEPPDLVLLSFGHNQTPENAQRDFQGLLEEIRGVHGDVPVVVILQQPQAGDANAMVRGLISGWARTEGLATVDVAGAFLEEREFGHLLEDPIHPNQDGSGLWADTVALALSP